VKRAAEGILARSGIAWMVGRRARRRGLILAYHNIVPAGCARVGEISLHLPQAAFERQLDRLEARADVLPLRDLLRTDRPASPRPQVAITFDDAYQGAVTAGVEALARRGFPATIFVAPAFVGGASFWWDALAGTAGGLPAPIRSMALDTLRGEDARVREWARERRLPMADLPAHARAATETELIAAAQQPGITIGSHSWSHPNLARLGAAELREELVKSRDWLAAGFSLRFVPWLSFPYGAYSEGVARAAAEAGYLGALRIDGGRLPRASSYTVPRLNVPAGLSVDGFSLRLAGLPL
ncbi:MAG: polysaccharide deacetylase family protein, partial [Gemmatimonadales bacterium]